VLRLTSADPLDDLHPAFVVRPPRGSRPSRPGRRVTPRELDVLQLIADGLANNAIAHSLEVSEETVKTHVQHLLRKTHARGRAHAVAIGLRSGLID
jgi:DNA-binding NarL/FixJ family response regulator